MCNPFPNRVLLVDLVELHQPRQGAGSGVSLQEKGWSKTVVFWCRLSDRVWDKRYQAYNKDGLTNIQRFQRSGIHQSKSWSQLKTMEGKQLEIVFRKVQRPPYPDEVETNNKQDEESKPCSEQVWSILNSAPKVRQSQTKGKKQSQLYDLQMSLFQVSSNIDIEDSMRSETGNQAHERRRVWSISKLEDEWQLNSNQE